MTAFDPFLPLAKRWLPIQRGQVPMLPPFLKAVIAVLPSIGHAAGMVKHARPLISVSLTWAALLSPALAIAGPPTPFSPSAEVVLYRGATLIDGTGSPARPDMDVLVAGERIA